MTQVAEMRDMGVSSRRQEKATHLSSMHGSREHGPLSHSTLLVTDRHVCIYTQLLQSSSTDPIELKWSSTDTRNMHVPCQAVHSVLQEHCMPLLALAWHTSRDMYLCDTPKPMKEKRLQQADCTGFNQACIHVRPPVHMRPPPTHSCSMPHLPVSTRLALPVRSLFL